MATPHHFEIAVVIFETQCNVIARLEAMVGQRLTKSICGVIQFFIRVCKAALGHYNCKLVGCGLSDVSWEHAYYGSGDGSFKESRKGGINECI